MTSSVPISLNAASTRSTFEMPSAFFVASMLRWMYGISRVLTFGCTTKRWITAGYTLPATSATTTHRPTAMAGRRQPRWRMFQSSNAVTASDTRIIRFRAGNCAFTSVYSAPRTTPRSDDVRSYFDSQYAAARSSAMPASSTDRCTLACGDTRCTRSCGRMLPLMKWKAVTMMVTRMSAPNAHDTTNCANGRRNT